MTAFTSQVQGQVLTDVLEEAPNYLDHNMTANDGATSDCTQSEQQFLNTLD